MEYSSNGIVGGLVFHHDRKALSDPCKGTGGAFLLDEDIIQKTVSHNKHPPIEVEMWRLAKRKASG